jgi:hypothetical protein
MPRTETRILGLSTSVVSTIVTTGWRSVRHPPLYTVRRTGLAHLHAAELHAHKMGASNMHALSFFRAREPSANELEC